MLPRSHRLPRAGFEQIAGLQRAASRHFSVSYIIESSSDSMLLSGGAVVVSKKVAKRSVDRHQLKRRIKAVMRPFLVPGRVLIIHAGHH